MEEEIEQKKARFNEETAESNGCNEIFLLSRHARIEIWMRAKTEVDTDRRIVMRLTDAIFHSASTLRCFYVSRLGQRPQIQKMQNLGSTGFLHIVCTNQHQIQKMLCQQPQQSIIIIIIVAIVLIWDKAVDNQRKGTTLGKVTPITRTNPEKDAASMQPVTMNKINVRLRRKQWSAFPDVRPPTRRRARLRLQ